MNDGEQAAENAAWMARLARTVEPVLAPSPKKGARACLRVHSLALIGTRMGLLRKVLVHVEIVRTGRPDCQRSAIVAQHHGQAGTSPVPSHKHLAFVLVVTTKRSSKLSSKRPSGSWFPRHQVRPSRGASLALNTW